MDGAALDEAYNAAKSADTATLAGDYTKAVASHTDAAKYFTQAASESPSNPARRVLQALADQQRARAKYLGSGKARQDAKKAALAAAASAPSQSQGASQISSQITSQLAAARAPAPLSMPGGLPSANTVASTPSSTSIASLAAAATVEDAVGGLQARAASAYARAFDQALLAARGTDPSESFYLVGTHQPGATGEDARNVDLGARVHALEAAARAQQQAFKAGLAQLQRELSQREQRLIDEHTEEVDRLRAENDRLNNQVTKLKSRWDELKESAKKRRPAP